MFTKLRAQLVLAAVLLIWTTGGLVAGVAYLQLDRGIRREARARVEAAVNAALRLLEDGACVEGGEEIDVRSFVRIQDPKLKDRKGSGVGLYLCRRIVELHGGRVGVEGDYGRWVRFWFEVPAS